MSKFGVLMEYLDLKNYKIEKREFPQGVNPITPQDICVVPLKLAEISEEAKRKTKARVIEIRGQINELGIGGYMSNQKNPLAPTTYRPSEGVKLREPHTIIVGLGKCWVCGDKELTRQGTFILTPEIAKQFEGGE